MKQRVYVLSLIKVSDQSLLMCADIRSEQLSFEPRNEKTIFFFNCENKGTVQLISTFVLATYMSLVVRKPFFWHMENKDADQLRGNREADQRLSFRYTDSTIPILPKYEISSL